MAEGDGLLNADQPVGHFRFSTQIRAFQSLPRSSTLATVDGISGHGRLRERDAPEQAAEPGGLVAFDDESGSMNQRPQPSIDVGEQRSRHEVHEPSRIRGLLLLAQELVEYRDTSA